MAEALVAESAKRGEGGAAALPVGGGVDLAAAKALIPWLNQALGMPTERHERTLPSIDEVDEANTEALEELVRRGRE